MSFTLQTIWNKGLVLLFVVVASIFAIAAAMPQTASAAAALTLSSASSTSNNASTTAAKIGDTVTFAIQVSGTPWTQGSSTINIFNLGSTTMSTPNNAQGVYWTYSTTTSSANAWSEGAITAYVAWGNTDGTATSTTFLTSNVVYDKTAPSDPVADVDSGTYSTNQSVSLTSSGSTYIMYTFKLDGTNPTDPTCTSGTTYSGAISVTSAYNLEAIGCDTAHNASSVVSYSYVIHGGSSGGGSSHSSSGGGGGGSSSHSSTPSTPAATTGAGGLSGGQVTSIMDLLRSFGADAITLAKVQASLNGTTVSFPTTGAGAGTFTRDLTIGSSGADVTALQVFLNTHGYPVAAAGPGSLGSETALFGGLTQAALAKFQAANGIAPAIGYFGPKTRAVVSAM